MKKLIMSLAMVALALSTAAGATKAYFSSSATVNDVTFATGVLEIRVNGQPSTMGFSATNMKPGDCKAGQFNVNNANLGNFGGASTLTAKSLTLNIADFKGAGDLFNALKLKLEVNTGWADRAFVYEGALNAVSNANLFDSRYSELAPGNSIDVFYEVCLPENGNQTSLQGKTTSFDFAVEGRTN